MSPRSRSFGPWLLTACCFFAASACGTVETEVETPSGERETVEGPAHILRVLRRVTTSGNQPNATDAYREDVVVRCPSGTETVVPVMNEQVYGYGEITPDDLSMVSPEGGFSFQADLDDQHLGVVHSGVRVADVDAPGPDGEQTVTLNVVARLADNDFGNRWWWVGSYTVLCIGTPEIE